MVISDEIKFPRVLPVDAFRKKRRVEEVFAIPGIARIGDFRQEREQQREQQRPPPKRRPLNDSEVRAVRYQVQRANRDFEQQGVQLRLLLTRTDDGWLIDVYDCTDDTVCQLAADLHLTVDELPALLRNLEAESGLIIDTVT